LEIEEARPRGESTQSQRGERGLAELRDVGITKDPVCNGQRCIVFDRKLGGFDASVLLDRDVLNLH
jgi:hypothetical protein